MAKLKFGHILDLPSTMYEIETRLEPAGSLKLLRLQFSKTLQLILNSKHILNCH